MGKGKFAAMAAIMSSMKEATPEMAKAIGEYLTKKTQVSYDKMEVTLKAAGFTVEQYFKSLEENSSSKEFIESYRHTAAIAAQIEIIRNSTEIPDVEKIERLNKIHEAEVRQQKEAVEALHQKRVDHMKAIGGVMAGTLILTSKTVGPALVKSTKTIGKTAVKVVKLLPKK